MSQNHEYFYLNHKIIPSSEATIHISDLGLLRGYGIFDYFRAVDGVPIFIEDHLDRFENSAKLMGLQIPDGRKHLRETIHELIQLNNHPLSGIKLVLTGGYSADGYIPDPVANLMMLVKPFKFMEAPDGLKLISVAYQREIPEIKTTNYIFPIRLQAKLRENRADDLLYHLNGFVSESSRSNIFIIKNEKIITPDQNVLPGITRKHVLKVVRQYFEVEERNISVKEFFEADEIFTTGSTKRIIPVTQVDNQIFSQGKPGMITQKLSKLFLAYEEETKNIPV